MISWGEQILLGGLLMTAMMVLLWLRQRSTGNAGIVDLGWTLGLGVLALFYAMTSDGEPSRKWLLVIVTGTWSIRLGLHLWRRIAAEPEDGRYQTLRRSWGNRADLYLLLFFLAQALFDVMFSVPMLVVAHNRAPLSGWDAAALLVAVASIVGESVADRQLAAFRRDPDNRSRTCRVGFWRYSRHPNYFFEWLHWWCYVLMSVGSPAWWVTLAGPALMLLFLFRVTGIPATEAQALKRRGDDYRDYQATTSAFFPWPPKRRPSGGAS